MNTLDFLEKLEDEEIKRRRCKKDGYKDRKSD